MKIDSYSFGSIVIDGKTYENDIIVSAKELIPDWWREEGHSLSIADIKQIIDKDYDILIVGTGDMGAMDIPGKTKEYIESHGIELITQKTPEAINIYNDLLEQGRKVIGAFHLTC